MPFAAGIRVKGRRPLRAVRPGSYADPATYSGVVQSMLSPSALMLRSGAESPGIRSGRFRGATAAESARIEAAWRAGGSCGDAHVLELNLQASVHADEFRIHALEGAGRDDAAEKEARDNLIADPVLRPV